MSTSSFGHHKVEITSSTKAAASRRYDFISWACAQNPLDVLSLIATTASEVTFMLHLDGVRYPEVADE